MHANNPAMDDGRGPADEMGIKSRDFPSQLPRWSSILHPVPFAPTALPGPISLWISLFPFGARDRHFVRLRSAFLPLLLTLAAPVFPIARARSHRRPGGSIFPLPQLRTRDFLRAPPHAQAIPVRSWQAVAFACWRGFVPFFSRSRPEDCSAVPAPSISLLHPARALSHSLATGVRSLARSHSRLPVCAGVRLNASPRTHAGGRVSDPATLVRIGIGFGAKRLPGLPYK